MNTLDTLFDADASHDPVVEWLRTFTTLEDIANGTIPDVPADVVWGDEGPDTYQGVTYPAQCERM